MDKPKIAIRDSNFFSDVYPVRFGKEFEWLWNRSRETYDIEVFTDQHIPEASRSQSKVKVAWLIEPPIMVPDIYQFVKENHQIFDAVFTFDDSLLKIDPKFKSCLYGSTWVHPHERGIHPKTKSVSAVLSGKTYTEDQRFRHEIVQALSDKFDFYGRDYRPVKHKIEALKDYRYSIAVENQLLSTYFSEKIIDCFMSGSIPIYWGTHKIVEYFDSRGMFLFNTLDDLRDILERCTEEEYEKRLPFVKENYKRALEMDFVDDSIWARGLKEIYMNI
jgi:hypothetical protein